MRWAFGIAFAILGVAALLAMVLPASDSLPAVRPDGTVVEAEASWLGRFTQLVSVVGLPAAVVGLALVYQQLRATHRAQRVEWGPLVRVDLVPTELSDLPDIQLPHAYFESDAEALALDAGEQSFRGMSLWLRNLQPHALGIAYGVRATVVVEQESSPLTWHELEIPYLTHDRAVRLEVVRFHPMRSITARVTSLRYQDLYHSGVRSTWPSGPEAWHGRLVCRHVDGVFYAEPIYEPPRGPWLHRMSHRLRGVLRGDTQG